MKRTLSILLSALLIVISAACSNTSVSDAEAFVAGNLDSTLKNIHSMQYSSLTGEDISSLEGYYISGLSSEAMHFLNYIDAAGGSEDIVNEAESMVEKLWLGTSYKVSGVYQSDDYFVVSIDFYPIMNIANALKIDVDGIITQLEDRFGKELYSLSEDEYTAAYTKELIRLIDADNISYGKQQTANVKLQMGKDKKYRISDDDFIGFYSKIIPYE